MKRITLTDFEASELADALGMVVEDIMEAHWEEEVDQRSADVRIEALNGVIEAVEGAEDVPCELSKGEVGAIARELKRLFTPATLGVPTGEGFKVADLKKLRDDMNATPTGIWWAWRTDSNRGTVLARTADEALATLTGKGVWPPLDSDAERVATARGRWLQLFGTHGEIVRRRGATPLAN